MSENILVTIKIINLKCDNNDFCSARKLLEKHINIIPKENYWQLNDNARALVKHIKSEINLDRHQFDHAELSTIHHINRYSSTFDIPMLKRIIKNSSDLLSKPSILPLLNKDAEYLLKTMGVISNSTPCPKINS